MAGLGTDEEAIYSALSGRTREQVDAITETYQRMYPGRNLQADLRDELNDDELLRLALFDPTNTRTGTAAEQVARQLDQAMRGLGTDESSIFAALTGRTATEIANIKTAYRSLTNRDLEADLRDELSGAELIEALRLLNQGVLAPEDEIYLAIAGLGTDEARIFRVVDAMRGNPTAIRELDRNYRTKYGDLIADLRGDLSGDDYDHVRAVLAPVLQDVSFQDCSNPSNIQDVRTAIREALEDIQAAIRVLSKGLSGMSATERDTFNKFFDPSSSGVDQRFVGDVLSNYRRIQAEMNRDYSIQCETATDPTCASAPPGSHVGGYVPPLVFRFFGFHTDVHVCPGFFGDPQPTQVRTIIHETTHNAIVAEDRPYAQDPNYARMTPRGSLAGQIPLIGPIITVALRRDTLNAPDAYACFALTIAGLFEPSCDCAPTCPP